MLRCALLLLLAASGALADSHRRLQGDSLAWPIRGPQGKNVLFIAADDMRPEISPYGHKYSEFMEPDAGLSCALCAVRAASQPAPWLPAVHTPNMQSLADDGYTFRRMYVQQALCAPSRTVLLTGRRPDRSHVWVIGPCERCPAPSSQPRA